MPNRTLIIAEAGVNHNGDVALAAQLVYAAAAAEADVVKFQTFKADRLATEAAPKADYQEERTATSQSQLEMLSGLELSEQMHGSLITDCREAGIKFFSSAFDIESVEYLASLGADMFKVPSGEITNLPYLRKVGSYGKPVILSTGMASTKEIESAIIALEFAGTPRSLITALHCNTDYPTHMVDVNLRAMKTIGTEFGVAVGYSDHTMGIEVAIAAVALGAAVIEKHLTLDRGLPGPDHKASLEPEEFGAMVRAIRNIELAMGSTEKIPSPSELRNRPIARKSLVAAVPIKAGEIFTEKNVTAKRPGIGISPMRWDEIIGQEATRDYQKDDLL
jgi:N,N'-diacetyllegionaminate synthase